jgi:ubiquinone/menaquinone biosynthesis C-methylase UbiE
MLEIAERPAEKLGLDVTFRIMDTKTLEFPDESFDTVVSSLALCTFPDPLAALGEMKRVCRIDGRLLLLEHGRSERGWLGRFQDRREDAHAERFGCYWNREPLELVEEAGLKPISTRLAFLGILHEIEARRLE